MFDSKSQKNVGKKAHVNRKASSAQPRPGMIRSDHMMCSHSHNHNHNNQNPNPQIQHFDTITL